MPIFEILKKYDGQRIHDDIKNGRRKYRLTRLPKYMILHMKRFTKNNFFIEKNPTIVNFPVKNLELKDIIPVPTGEALDPYLPHRIVCIATSRTKDSYITYQGLELYVTDFCVDPRVCQFCARAYFKKYSVFVQGRRAQTCSASMI